MTNKVALLAVLVGMSGCHQKTQVVHIPEGKQSRDFWLNTPGRECLIVIPPGRTLNLFGVVTIKPNKEGQLDDPPPLAMSYGCDFEVTVGDKVTAPVFQTEQHAKPTGIAEGGE